MFIPCRNCANKKGPEPGYYYVKINGFNAVQECECHKSWRRSEELYRLAEESNVYTSLSFRDYKGDLSRTDLRCLQKVAENPKKFLDRGSMIYLYGPNGTQKTSMAKVLGYSLIKSDYSVYYTRMNKMIQVAIDANSFNDGGSLTAENSYRKMLASDFLIIDESFDKNKITLYRSGYQIPYLDNFIRERYESKRKPIIFISNVKPTEIDENLFGKSLKDLIVRSTAESCLEFYDKFIENRINTSRTALFN